MFIRAKTHADLCLHTFWYPRFHDAFPTVLTRRETGGGALAAAAAAAARAAPGRDAPGQGCSPRAGMLPPARDAPGQGCSSGQGCSRASALASRLPQGSTTAAVITQVVPILGLENRPVVSSVPTECHLFDAVAF